VQFTTVAHEPAHLFLGHLGPDKKLSIPERTSMDRGQTELEAESVAYIVCARNGIASASETYLKDYVKANTTVDHIDIYRVMRAAGQVEALLGLTEHTKFDRLAGTSTWSLGGGRRPRRGRAELKPRSRPRLLAVQPARPSIPSHSAA